MRLFKLFLLVVSIGVPLACGGPEVGTSGSGSGRNVNRGGSAGSTGGSAGDGLGGDFSGAGGFAGESDAETSDAGAETDGATESDAPSDATSDTRADGPNLSACTPQPQYDGQCGSTRPPHRYTCPLSAGTPSGCVRTGTNSSTAYVCCP